MAFQGLVPRQDTNVVDVRLAVKDWIARSTKQGQSDIFVFFAGHGLPERLMLWSSTILWCVASLVNLLNMKKIHKGVNTTR